MGQSKKKPRYNEGIPPLKSSSFFNPTVEQAKQNRDARRAIIIDKKKRNRVEHVGGMHVEDKYKINECEAESDSETKPFLAPSYNRETSDRKTRNRISAQKSRNKVYRKLAELDELRVLNEELKKDNSDLLAKIKILTEERDFFVSKVDELELEEDTAMLFLMSNSSPNGGMSPNAASQHGLFSQESLISPTRRLSQQNLNSPTTGLFANYLQYVLSPALDPKPLF